MCPKPGDEHPYKIAWEQLCTHNIKFIFLRKIVGTTNFDIYTAGTPMRVLTPFLLHPHIYWPNLHYVKKTTTTNRYFLNADHSLDVTLFHPPVHLFCACGWGSQVEGRPALLLLLMSCLITA